MGIRGIERQVIERVKEEERGGRNRMKEDERFTREHGDLCLPHASWTATLFYCLLSRIILAFVFHLAAGSNVRQGSACVSRDADFPDSG